jgi:hypothetical protein
VDPDDFERRTAALRQLALVVAERLAKVDRDLDLLREYIDQAEALIALQGDSGQTPYAGPT